jgi:hypothetical protein
LVRTEQHLIPNALAAGVDREYFDEDGQLCRMDCLSEVASDPIHSMFFNGAGISSCSLFRTSAAIKGGAWPEELEQAEDFKLFVDIAQIGRCFLRVILWKPTMFRSWRRLAVASVTRRRAA